MKYLFSLNTGMKYSCFCEDIPFSRWLGSIVAVKILVFGYQESQKPLLVLF